VRLVLRRMSATDLIGKARIKAKNSRARRPVRK
jgi:hypothetical protein